MFNPLFLSLILLMSNAAVFTQRVFPSKHKDQITITFGSCNKYYGDENDDIFYRIAEVNSDLWVWLGDVAYVDKKILPPIFGYAGEKMVKEKFDNAKNSPPYVKLRETTSIVGVWDDHDYGLNNAGKSFEYKDITQRLWLDFIDEPKDSPRRTRKGIYDSYYVGDKTKVKIILLDVRYFKDDYPPFGEKNTDILGSEQWDWLENELKTNTAQFVLIGSGVQVLPDDRIVPEFWFTESRDKLISLIRKYEVSGTVFISGDVHFAEFLQHPCPQRIGFQLHEVTSSGLTHHVSSHVPFAKYFVNYMFPSTFSKPADRFCGENFGVIQFDFKDQKQMKIEIRDLSGRKVMENILTYKELMFNESIIDDKAECITDENRHLRYVKNYFNSLLTGKLPVYGITLVITLLTFILLVIMYGIFFTFKKLLFFALCRKKPIKLKQA